jgi:UDP:flavonoid glycosyltransferase YjiC (YdhE family)
MASKKLTILFTPLDGHGHINACHGLAEELRDRGHRIVFAIDIAFKDRLIPYGFEEAIHGLPADGTDSGEEFWPIFAEQHAEDFKLDPIGVAEHFFLNATKKMFADNREREHQYKEIIDRIKPDIIINDAYICSPTLTNSGIPWIWLFSAAPHLCLMDERIPPAWSGMSSFCNFAQLFLSNYETIFLFILKI